MKLSAKTAFIAPEKLRDYALNPAHEEGKSKARFLGEMGYDQAHWQQLASDLKAQHLSVEAAPGKKSIYGAKYEIVAPLTGPNGETRWLRSVWIIRKSETFARFVTIIPE